MSVSWKAKGAIALVLVASTGVLAASSAAETRGPQTGPCGAGLDGFGNIVHSFNRSGGCHDGAPNAVHYDDQPGFCGEWHYVCAS